MSEVIQSDLYKLENILIYINELQDCEFLQIAWGKFHCHKNKAEHPTGHVSELHPSRSTITVHEIEQHYKWPLRYGPYRRLQGIFRERSWRVYLLK